ncbi:amidohydrolase 2 [Parafrankia sp. EAN1pec]|nr:amidohydrolase 2 [Frankia sp. EAN1pec]
MLASLDFPSMARFCGQFFASRVDQDPGLALAVLKAYNDWHLDAWCGSYRDRFIPCSIPPIWDPQLMAAEIRRTAAKGSHAVSFSMNPYALGLPSLHSDHWDPFWAACQETETVVCVHIGSGRHRVDYTYKQHKAWTRPNLGGRLPSEVFLDHVVTCFIVDAFGLANLDRMNEDMITWECDYPNSDSTWPRSPEVVAEAVAGLTDTQVDKVTHLNAMRVFSFDPFALRPREQCTTGALRREVAGHDISIVSRGTRDWKAVTVDSSPTRTSRPARRERGATRRGAGARGGLARFRPVVGGRARRVGNP